MREFFRGWKRKVGCVTLLMACVLMAAWMRSGRYLEVVRLFQSDTCLHTIYSDRGNIQWETFHDLSSGLITPPLAPTQIIQLLKGIRSQTPFHQTIRVKDAEMLIQMAEPFSKVETEWRWEFAGFHFGAGRHSQNKQQAISVGRIPYWSIVFPLTAVSAWLLLSKPRPKINAPITPVRENR